MSGTCPVCKLPAVVNGLGAIDGYAVDCVRCGIFESTEEAAHSLRGYPRAGLALSKQATHVSGFLRHLHERTHLASNRRIPRLVTSLKNVQPAPTFMVGMDDALAEFPLSVKERLDALLKCLAWKSAHPGEFVAVHNATDYPLGYCENLTAFEFLMDQLRDDGLIREGNSSQGRAIVTAKGWNRFAELERGARASKPFQGFIAMYMDDNRRGEWELGLKEGVGRAGYSPLVIDAVEFLGPVMDRIIAEIRQSRFVVADFTGHRQNVYFEAGFAEGLGIPVFSTCHKDDMKDLHFDRVHQNTIVWKNHGELADLLHRRIEAVIGRPPIQTHIT